MRVLVMGTPKFPLSPEQLPAMIEGALAWHERYEDRFEVFGNFVGGGFAVVNVPAGETLNQMVIEMPFAWVSDVTVRPFVDGMTGFKQLQEATAAMGAAR